MTTTTTAPFLRLSAPEAGNQALAEAIQWAGEEYGRVTKIADALSTATGSKVSRQMASRWLNQDPAKRVPIGSLGMGLMLLHVVSMLRLEPMMSGEQPPLTMATLGIQLLSKEAPKTKKTKSKK